MTGDAIFSEILLCWRVRIIYTKKTVFNLEAIVFSISSIQKVVQFSKSNPTNYLEESRDVIDNVKMWNLKNNRILLLHMNDMVKMEDLEIFW